MPRPGPVASPVGHGRIGWPARLSELARIPQRLCERLERWRLPGSARRSQQGAPQAAQPEGVGATQWPGEQLRGGLLIECLRADRARQQPQQRPGAWLDRERELIAGHVHRDPGARQGALERRRLARCRSDQHGHLRPGGAIDKVSAAERVRDERRLLARACRGDDLDPAGIGVLHGDEHSVRAAGGDTLMSGRHRQSGGDPSRRGQQHSAAAAAGLQGDYLRRPAIWCAEAVPEPPDRVHIRAAERINRLVRVADGDQLAPIPGELSQQLLLSRIGVLILVHQDHVVGLALAGPDSAAAQQRAGDPDDLGVVVGRHRGQVEPGRVGVQEPASGDPVVSAVSSAKCRQAAAIEPALCRAQQEVPELRREALGPDSSP